MLLLVGDVDEGAGVSHGDMSVADGDLHLGGQLQQSQEIGHGTAALANLVAHFLLGHVTFVDEALVGDGHLNGVQVLAMDVFDEGQFKHLLIVSHADEHRNLGQTCHFGGPQSALAGNELVFVVAEFPDRNRLDHTLFLDGLCQLFQGCFVEFRSGLEGVGFDEVDVDFGDGTGHEIAADVFAGDVGFGALQDGV